MQTGKLSNGTDRHMCPQSQDILGQPFSVSDISARTKIDSFPGERTTVFAANAPYLDTNNRFFKPIGTPRI